MSGFPFGPNRRLHLPKGHEVPRALRRHLWLIGVCVVGAAGIATWLGFHETPEYRATAILRFVDGTPVDFVALTDRAVLGRVVDREGLRLFAGTTGAPAGFVEDAQTSLSPQQSGTIHLDFEDDEIIYGPPGQRRSASYGERVGLNGADFVVSSRPGKASATLHVVPRDAAIEQVLSGLISVVDESVGSIRVAFTSVDARLASRVVNAVAEEFQEASAERARQGIRERRVSLEEELRATDSLLSVAGIELALVRSREQSIRSQVELRAELRLFETLLNQVLQARSSGRLGDLTLPRATPAIAGDPVVGPLYARLFAYRVERDGMLAGPQAILPEHPDVQRLSTLIAAAERSLVEAIGARIGRLRGQIKVLGSNSVSGTDVQVVELTRSMVELKQTAGELRARYQEVRLKEGMEVGPVEIVELSGRARRLPSNLSIKLLVALVVGLMLGGAAAVVREGFGKSNGTPKRSEKIEHENGSAIEGITVVPTLVVIPEVTPSLVEPGSNSDFRPGPSQSSGLEAYRELRARLLSSSWGLKTLVVTSAHPGEGKTTTATNLAATYARQGQKVVLVECDLRRPSLGRYFGITKETDLMDVLFENHDWRWAIQLTKMPGLYVILGEKSFPKAGDSLGGPEMKRLLAELSSEYDLVILDTSPLLIAEDATVLGPIVDGVLIVVRATRADDATQREVVRKLTNVGANIIGMVLNDPEGVAS